MTFVDMLTDDLDVFLDIDALAVEASYRAKGSGSSTAVTVLLEQIRDDYTPVRRDGVDYFAQQGHLYVAKSDVVAPGAGDVFTVGSSDWIVQEIAGGSPVVWRLVVYSTARAGKNK